MFRSIRRRYEKESGLKSHGSASRSQGLKLEALEPRVLLDVAGWWDELGWRSASGGGVTWDVQTDPGHAQLVLSSDGDPVALWVDGGLPTQQGEGDTTGRYPYHWEVSGNIYARQYAGDLGWWDMESGGGDVIALGNGTELTAASGAHGEIAAAWVTGNDIYVKAWNGSSWQGVNGSANDLGISGGVSSDKPSVAISGDGTIYVAYSATHPISQQREIVVKSYAYGASLAGDSVQVWEEVISDEVGDFGSIGQVTGGVSNSMARSVDPSIAVNASGEPIVVWASEANQGNVEIVARKWDGDSWEALGTEGAVDVDADGLYGLSHDGGVSLQPDVAVADDGTVVVTWVNWANWQDYNNDGQASIFVKKLEAGSQTWEAYTAGSASGDGVSTTGVSWYYNPILDLDSDGNPLITWQGWEPDPEIREPNNIYVSYYQGGSFSYLASFFDPEGEKANYRGAFDCYMPTVLIGANDEILLAYTWRDETTDYHNDNEIFVEEWIGFHWWEYGRGSDSNGNDVFGGLLNSTGDTQVGVIDFDGDPSTEMDVMLANGEHVYLYRRETGTWTNTGEFSAINPGLSYGPVFDLRGEPEVEYDVAGNPLLAYIDWWSGDPYVLEWTDGEWKLVGDGTAGDGVRSGNLSGNMGISVQAGSNGKILVAYVSEDSDTGTDEVIARLWDPTVGTWEYAGSYAGGVVPLEEGLRLGYEADFDGIDFTTWLGGNWTFTTESTAEEFLPLVGAITGQIADDAGIEVENFEETLDGLEIRVEGGGEAATLVGRYDYVFDMVADGYVMVDMDYELDASMVRDMGLKFTLEFRGADGEIIYPDPDDHNVTIDIDSVLATEIVEYGSGVGVPMDSLLEGNGVLLLEGVNTVSVVLTATIDGSGLPGYEWPFDGDLDDWLYADVTDAGGNATGDYNGGTDETDGYFAGDGTVDNADLNGNSGGLLIDLDTASEGGADLVGAFDRVFALGGDVTIDFSYQLVAEAGTDTDAELRLMVYLCDGNVFDENTAVAITSDDPENEDDLLYIGLTVDDDGNADVLGWETASITLADVNELAALQGLGTGEHTLRIEASMLGDASGGGVVLLDNVTITPLDPAGYLRVDNFTVYQRVVDHDGSGNVDWAMAESGDDTGENPFQGALHIELGGAGSEQYVIKDIVQEDDGRMVVSFRYRLLGSADPDAEDHIHVYIDDPSTVGYYDYGFENIEYAEADIDGVRDSGWTWTRVYASDLLDDWVSEGTRDTSQDGYVYDFTNGDNDVNDRWERGIVLDIPEGTYDIIIELENGSGNETDLWIDNLAVLTSVQTNGIKPIVSLLPTGTVGSDERNFVVAVTNESPGIGVYASGDDDSDGETYRYKDGEILDAGDTTTEDVSGFESDFASAYCTSHLAELDLAPSGEQDLPGRSWSRYGNVFEWTEGIDFLGFSSSQYLSGSDDQTEGEVTWTHANADGVLSDDEYDLLYRFEMPGGELYQIEDLAIGYDAVEWVALTHSTSRWLSGVDVSLPAEEGEDPVVVEDPFITRFDYQTVEIHRWDPWNIWNAEGGEYSGPNWMDTVLTFDGDNPVYSGIQLVSAGSQDITVSWINWEALADFEVEFSWAPEDFNPEGYGVLGSSSAKRFKNNGWELFGDSESTQNNQFWSAQRLKDLILNEEGLPIVSFWLGHMGTDGVREFRLASDLPGLVVQEESGTFNDDRLEFGQSLYDPDNADPVEISINISNSGVGELILYDVSFGGYGDLASSPFSLVTPPEGFPDENHITLAQAGQDGDSKSLVVRFDPTGVPVGDYQAVMVLYTNDVSNPNHPFSHYYEVILDASVINESGLIINANDLLLEFGDTIINDGGVPNLEGAFRQEFSAASSGNVAVSLDYQLSLGANVAAGESLSLIASIDGQDVTTIANIVSGAVQDTGYVSVNLTLPNVAAGSHVFELRGELSKSQGGQGGTGIVRLDNIVLAGTTYRFTQDPGAGKWDFEDDQENPEATDGDWSAIAGKSGGGLEMVLGHPWEIQTVAISNNENATADLVIQEWAFSGPGFRLLDVATDGQAGVVVQRPQGLGEPIIEEFGSVNTSLSTDDIALGAGDSITFYVVFEPTELIAYSEAFTIRTSDSDTPRVIVNLNGEGVSGANILVEQVSGAERTIIPDDGQVDFGSVIRGQSKDVTLEITNNGSTDLTVSSVLERLAPLASPSLVITPWIEDDVLGPDESITVTLTYSPLIGEGEGALDITNLSTRIRILNDDPDLTEKLYDITVAGQGVPAGIPMIKLVDSETGEVLDPTRLDFGSSYIGQPVTRTFAIMNIGGTDLRLESFQVITDVMNPYSISPVNQPNNDDDDIILAFGAEAYLVTVTYTPMDSDRVEKTLRVSYFDENDQVTFDPAGSGPGGGSVLTLIGRGSGQQLSVLDENDVAIADGGVLDFGLVNPTTQAVEEMIVLKNAGSSDLTITNWVLSDNGGGVFEIETFGSDIVLSPDETEEVVVSFLPTAQGMGYDGTVVISSDDPNHLTWTVNLSGFGVGAGEVMLDLAELDFGTLLLNSSATQIVTISNTGDSPIQVEGITTSSSYFIPAYSELEANDFVIGVGESYPISVTFYANSMLDTTAMGEAPVLCVTTSDGTGQESVYTLPLRARTILSAEQPDVRTGTKLEWEESTNGTVKVMLSGPGTVTLYPITLDDFGINKEISQLVLTGTTSKSSLTVIGPEGKVRIGQITGSQIKNITLKNATLDGDLNGDGLEDYPSSLDVDLLTGKLNLEDLMGGADVSIGSVSSRGLNMRVEDVGTGSEIMVEHGGLKSFQAESFASGSVLEIATLNRFKMGKGVFGGTVEVEGSLTNASFMGTEVGGSFLIGDELKQFNANKAVFTGTLSADTIGRMKVDSLDGAVVSARDRIAKLNVKNDVLDSVILGGYDLGVDNQFGGGDDQLVYGGVIDQVTAGGALKDSFVMAGIATNSSGTFNVFGVQVPTAVTAGQVGNVRFGSLSAENTLSGVGAHTIISQVKLGRDRFVPGTGLPGFEVDLL